MRVGGVTTAFRLAACGMFFVTIIPYLTLKEEVVRAPRADEHSKTSRFASPTGSWSRLSLVSSLFSVASVTQPTLSLYVSEMSGGGMDTALCPSGFSVAGLGTVGASVAGKRGNSGSSMRSAACSS